MRPSSTSSRGFLSRRTLSYSLLLALFSLPALAQVTITSPASGSTSISAVTIAASASESESFHLEIWDNGYKLGNVSADSVSNVYVLPNGAHTLSVDAVTSSGTVLDKSNVSFTVAENCTTSSTVQCNIDQQGINDIQNDCSPASSDLWVANPCGSGIQGTDGTDPSQTDIQSVTETGTIPDQGNTTLNGQSLHLSETQGGAGYSNVIFKADSPTPTPTSPVESHWTLDEYVYLPNPLAHQAFEMDAQYVISDVWTKFYTECAFNQSGSGADSTGYWGVFDTETGGWIFLNGVSQNGQTPPVVPCNRSQFAQPWSGSADASFSGWHHVVWTYLRNSTGTITFQTLTFDNLTYQVNFTPTSATGGSASNNGDFGALIQLDGASNPDSLYDTVDAYINELNVTHTE